MKITKFRVKNFKCFQDTGDISLSRGMNIVTGQNNAGKTALLHALSLDFVGVAHLSLASLPRPSAPSNRTSETEIVMEISGEELLEMANSCGQIYLAVPINLGGEFLQQSGVRLRSTNDVTGYTQLWQAMVNRKEHQFSLIRRAPLGATASTVAARIPSHGLFEVGNPGESTTNLVRQVLEDGTETFGIQYGGIPDLAIQIWPEIQKRIYRFTAERFGLADCICSNNKVLAGNASNLAEVLLNLRANPGRYEKYVDLIREILPQVKWIELEPIDGNKVRVKVWSIEKSTMRADLAMPLHECGTGIGQVLSIVYVVFTSDRPQLLLIDEPQSFLHPGAVRKLIEVLRRFPHHQYVISTHSASVIAASGSPEILIIEAEEGVSQIEIESTTDTQAMQRFLDSMGARLSDVFGMDRVLWVEGATEEKAIPLLLEKMNERRAGTAVVSIRSTGDLEGRDRKKAFEIYNNLTGKASMLPREVAFVLDRETRTADAMREITKLSGGRAHFLPRRTFENYLLHPAAICAVANEIEGFSEEGQTSIDQVDQSLQACLADESCWKPHRVPPHAELDVQKVHGARLLERVFARMSHDRVSYDKTEHSVELFKWIVENDRTFLAELEEFLRSILVNNRNHP